jgi:glutathione S-transferase
VGAAVEAVRAVVLGGDRSTRGFHAGDIVTDTLYFYSPGACSLGGIVVLEWLGEDYRLCRVEPAERTGSTYGRVNPQKKVPAIRVDGRTFAENGAILTHLAERRPDGSLAPKARSPDRDDLNEWLSYLSSGFHVAFYPLFMPQRYAVDPAAHATVKAAATEQLRAEASFVDGRLAGRSYVMGDARSVLDPYLYAMARWLRPMFDVASEFPHLARHLATMETDDGVRFGLAVERGDASVSSGGFKGHVALDDVAARHLLALQD